mmetsp:Transcript_29182/g.46556  ORF Transcript_29182/g.46556 Transcript_29182/m.46556 type:complete len:201 (+) Transcript_29182:842-1444(+)
MRRTGLRRRLLQCPLASLKRLGLEGKSPRRRRRKRKKPSSKGSPPKTLPRPNLTSAVSTTSAPAILSERHPTPPPPPHLAGLWELQLVPQRSISASEKAILLGTPNLKRRSLPLMALLASTGSDRGIRLVNRLRRPWRNQIQRLRPRRMTLGRTCLGRILLIILSLRRRFPSPRWQLGVVVKIRLVLGKLTIRLLTPSPR